MSWGPRLGGAAHFSRKEEPADSGAHPKAIFGQVLDGGHHRARGRIAPPHSAAAPLSQFLKECGCTVLAACDGLTALAMAREQQPDLNIRDATMPGIDGYAFCRMLKSDEKLNQLTSKILAERVLLKKFS